MRYLRLVHVGEPRLAERLDAHRLRLTPRGTQVADLFTDPDVHRGSRDDEIVRAVGARLLPPIDPGAVIVNIGANYHDHTLPAQAAPRPALTWFLKGPQTWVGHGEDVVVPEQWPDRVDYEGELGVVLGAPCYRVSPEAAMAYVGGWTLLNDVSARDAWPELAAATTPAQERAAWNRMMLGKQLPTFGPIGPELVMADEVGHPDRLTLRTTLNGEVVQEAAVTSMKIGIADLISRLSQYIAFRPGDVISTGTPGGVAQERGRFLRPGDEVAVSVEGIGTLRNRIVGV